MKGLELLKLPTLNPSFIVWPTLLYDENHVILVDCGYPGTYEELKMVLLDKGFSYDDLTHIIITHHDIDHIGNLSTIIKHHPEIKVLASYIEAPYLTGNKEPIKLSQKGYYDNLMQTVGLLPSPKRELVKEVIENLIINQVTVIHDNELLPFCGGIKVIYTPGHTPGHVCLYLESYKTLISGDELNVVEGILYGPKPQFTQNMTTAIESLSKIVKNDIRSIYCYHGGIYQDNPNLRIIQLLTIDEY